MAFDFSEEEFDLDIGQEAAVATLANLHKEWIAKMQADEYPNYFSWIHGDVSSDCICRCSVGNGNEVVGNRKFSRYVCSMPYVMLMDPPTHIRKVIADPVFTMFVHDSEYRKYDIGHGSKICNAICDKFCNSKITLEIDGTDRLPCLDSGVPIWDNLKYIDFCNIDFIEVRGAFDESLWSVDNMLSTRMRIYRVDLKPMMSMKLQPDRFWGTVVFAVNKQYDVQPFIGEPVFADAGWNDETSGRLLQLITDTDKDNRIDIASCDIDRVVPTSLDLMKTVGMTEFQNIYVDPYRSGMGEMSSAVIL